MLRQQPNFGNFGTVNDVVRNAKLDAVGSGAAVAGSKVRIGTANVMAAVGKAMDDADKDPLSGLSGLYGLQGVRKSLEQLRDSVSVAKRDGLPVPAVHGWSFVGSPGTGKTTVARSLADILHRLGLLATREVYAIKGGDLQGAFLGKAQENVNGAFREAAGKVLLIDEAYSMIGGFANGYGQ